ncbi:hypothetical protein [Taibaiella chishuiensis]|uniref:Uncharacterized protein n=1 Tax=Taibaiella chishuiensis TaxID=1434707 RepID=A0A2P8D0D6_9BACT|nr:hypothetical protein [Taibaiella chishuiensis]PSK90626.1 hypothetical protein B0I18_10736 [Taibaiella chishuiensis]
MNELNNLPEGMLAAVLAIVGVLVLAAAVVYCVYVKNLQDTLKAVRPQNRQMQPAQVWLLLISFLNIFLAIPIYFGLNGRLALSSGLFSGMEYISGAISLFTLIWQFRIVQKLSESIAQEYASRNMQVEPKPTFQPGLIYCILNLVSLLVGLLPRPVPGFGFAIGIGMIVYWIIYWVKTAAYKKEMRVMPEYNDNESDLFRNLY